MSQQNSTGHLRRDADNPGHESDNEQSSHRYYTRASAYYDKESPEFAPPVHLNTPDGQAGTGRIKATSFHEPAAANVYSSSSRKINHEPLQQSYQAEDVSSPPGKKFRLWLLIPIILIVILAACWFMFFRPKEEAVQTTAALPSESVPTPVPFSAYSSFTEPELNDDVRNEIAKIAPGINFTHSICTNQSVLAAAQRSDDLYDFYLFTADRGRLIAYYEGLHKNDAFFQQDGTLYVKQSPYCLNPNGTPVISPSTLANQFGSGCVLHPFYNGWAVVETSYGEFGFIKESGEAFSNVEFAKVFPFSGEYTLAWLDTGNTAGTEGRYALYLLKNDGTSKRIKHAETTDEFVLSVADLAITESGDIYRLPDLSHAVWHSDDIILYPEFNAMVLRDESTGKKALYINHEIAYPGRYDSILPAASDILWKTVLYQGENLTLAVIGCDPVQYSLPENYTFILSSGLSDEYVSLSRFTQYPLLFDGELPSPMEAVQ